MLEPGGQGDHGPPPHFCLRFLIFKPPYSPVLLIGAAFFNDPDDFCRFGRSINPIPRGGVGEIIPTTLLLPPNFQTSLRPCLVNWCRISRTLAASTALLKYPWKKLLDKTLAILFCGILLVSSFRRDFFFLAKCSWLVFKF